MLSQKLILIDFFNASNPLGLCHFSFLRCHISTSYHRHNCFYHISTSYHRHLSPHSLICLTFILSAPSLSFPFKMSYHIIVISLLFLSHFIIFSLLRCHIILILILEYACPSVCFCSSIIHVLFNLNFKMLH